MTKILTRKNSMQQVLFHFSNSTSSIKKSLKQYKKLPGINLYIKKKTISQNIL